MNKVCLSAFDVLNNRYGEIIYGMKNNYAVLGTADFRQAIITEEGFGIKPELSGNIIDESEPYEINTIAYGEGRQGHNYSIKNNFNLEAFNSATKDDLYLFVTMAHPQILQNNGELKNIIFNRLSEIHQDELSSNGQNAVELQAQQEIDRKKLEFVYEVISTAVKTQGYEVYHAEGHEPDDYQM